MAFRKWFIQAGLLLTAVAPAQAVIVTITNDLSQNEPGGVIEISDVVGVGVNKALRITLLPGDTKKVSPRNVTSFVVSRVFGDYKEKYAVQCPTDRRVKDSLRLTLKMVVDDQMGGGCVVERKGKWTVANGTSWEPTKLKSSYGEIR